MEIEVFAVLKEHFPASFQVEDAIPDVAALKRYLMGRSPASAGILESSRFAVGTTLVGEDYALRENDVVAVLPPSSGG